MSSKKRVEEEKSRAKRSWSKKQVDQKGAEARRK